MKRQNALDRLAALETVQRLICPPSPCAPMEELLRFMDESARWPQDDDVRYEREVIQRELDRRTFGKAPGGRLPFPLYDKLN